MFYFLKNPAMPLDIEANWACVDAFIDDSCCAN